MGTEPFMQAAAAALPSREPRPAGAGGRVQARLRHSSLLRAEAGL